MAEDNQERRLHPRIDVDGDMTYKVVDSDQIREGLLENMSMDGARIWIDQDLPTSTQVTFRVEPGSQGEPGMTFKATLLYRLPRINLTQFGFGCSIEVADDSPEAETSP